jgi:hypothetical protein
VRMLIFEYLLKWYGEKVRKSDLHAYGKSQIRHRVISIQYWINYEKDIG